MHVFWTEVPTTPEGAVSYDEADVVSAALLVGLELLGPIHYGSWCGRQEFLSVQDVAIFRRSSVRVEVT